MRVTECAEQRPRFEVEALGSGLMLLRLYEDEQRVQHEDVSGMDTPRDGWQYTTYEMRTQLPDGALDTAPDAWAAVIKRADYAAAAAEVRAERDKRKHEQKQNSRKQSRTKSAAAAFFGGDERSDKCGNKK